MRIATLAERPDLEDALWDMPTAWPEFMLHDPISNLYYGLCTRLWPEYILVAEDPAEPGRLVAKGHSVPFVLPEGDELPLDGWDGALRRAMRAKALGETPNIVSAIEISVRPDRQGTGLSALMLAAMRDNTARLGFADLVAPVRPNGAKDPLEPMTEYAYRTRDDGLPTDPWLRVHVRAGGVIEKIATRSMVIPGTCAEWAEWTGLPFDKTGPVLVPRALTPVHNDAEHDWAVYVEPNVWIRHRTGA